MHTVRQWLEELGLPQYAEVFAQNDVDLEALRLLAESDLEKLGVSLGHRKKVLKAIEGLRTGDTIAPPRSPDSYTPKHLAEKILTSKSALEGERKQVTVLFADLKGSMELLADRDPEEARKILDPVLEHMMEAVHHYEGTVNQVMGDGIMALFGAPLAHEDHAVRACNAALRLQEGVKRYAAELQRQGAAPVSIRVGINSGEVVVRSISSDLHMDYTAVGQTTHLASRVEQLAQPGSTLLTSATLKLAEGYVQVRSLGRVPVKGLAEPVELHELIGAGPARSRMQVVAARGLTKFVGRGLEMESLLLALERARKGHGQLVSVVGEPAIGKSRLFYEFIRSHHCEGWTILQAASVSYSKATSYLPVIDLLKTYFHIEDRDEPRLIRSKLIGSILDLDRALEPLLAPLLALMDVAVEDADWQRLDPPQRRRHTLDALRGLLLSESQVRPLLLVFEDLHWIDSETQALLDGLVGSLPNARILLLTNYRHEYQHDWGTKTYYTQVQLRALPPESATELLGGLLGQDSQLEALKRRLIKTTEGNPFYLEESVRSLVESGILQGERGVYRLTQQVSTIQVPATVQAVLAARIDRLSPNLKHVLQVASVIGKDVPLALLQTLAEDRDEDLRSKLAQLQAAEYLYETQLFPELEYTFKHALTHEVAYGSLLADRRRQLHAQILAAMKPLYGDRLSEHTERLAHHAHRGEVWDEAVRYCRDAGLRATERSANREAVTWFEQAGAAVDHLPVTPDTLGQAVDLRLEVRDPLFALGELNRVSQVLDEAQTLAESLGDEYRLARALAYFTPLYTWTSQHQRAVPSATRALALVESTDHQDVKVATLTFLGLTSIYTADFARASAAFAENIGLLNGELRLQRFGMNALPASYARALMGFVLAEQGNFAEALRIGREGIEVAAEVKHPFSEAVATMFLAHGHYRKGDAAKAIDLGENAMELSLASENLILHALASIFLAEASVGAGQFGRARTFAQEAERLFAGMHASLGQRQARCILVDAHLNASALDTALELATETLELVRAQGQRLLEVWLLKLIGEIYGSRNPPDLTRAQDTFAGAIRLAAELGMRPYLAHSRLGLGRVFGLMGRTEDAREQLAAALSMYRELDMYHWPEQAEAELRALN